MIRTSVEGVRGCGVRKPGGLYLVAGQLAEPCSRLPIPLDRCPHCGGGIGPARGWTWITPAVIVPAERHGSMEHNHRCPLGFQEVDGSALTDASWHKMGDRAGLIWVGEKFYPTPEAFMEEAALMGVSRRVSALPRNFKLGETWVLLGHRKAITAETLLSTGHIQPREIEEGVDYPKAGIITVFKPTAVEYVVTGDETNEEIENFEKRGISPVKVVNP